MYRFLEVLWLGEKLEYVLLTSNKLALPGYIVCSGSISCAHDWQPPPNIIDSAWDPIQNSLMDFGNLLLSSRNKTANETER